MLAEHALTLPHAKISRLVPIFCVAMACIGGFLYQATVADPSRFVWQLWGAEIVMLSIALSAIYATRAWPTVRGAIIRFELGPWWIIKYAIVFGLASIAWLNPQPKTSPILRSDVIPLAMIVASGALAAWAAGYVIGPPRFLTRPVQKIVQWALPEGEWAFRAQSVPILVYGVGIAARMFQIATGRYQYLGNPVFALNNPSSLNQIISMISGLARVGLILAIIQLVRFPTPRTKWIFRILLVSELAFALLGGMKEEFLMTFLVVLGVYGIARGRVSRVAMIAGLIGVLLIFPINFRYREFVRGNGIGSVTPSQAVSALPHILLSTFTNFNLRETASFSFDSGLGRLREIDNLAIIVQKSPQIVPFQGWNQILLAPVVTSIPRVLWREKPLIAAGYDFSIDYWEAPPTLYSSTAVTLPGDLYRYAGWWTLIPGMILMGTFARLTMRAVYRRDYLRFVAVYIPLFLLLTALENDYPSSLVGVTQTFLLLLLVCRYSFVTRTPRPSFTRP
jgi:hypothetical protein